MINEDKYIDFIIDNKLTQQQFLLLHLVFRKRWDLLRRYKETFPTNDGTIIGKTQTDRLLERGLLTYKKDSSNNTHLTVSDIFRKAYTNDIYIADEVYDTYPAFSDGSDGVRYPLLAYDRMSFAKIYLDIINYSQQEHEEILKDIEYGKENNLIKIKISNFLSSQFWKTLRGLRLKDESEENNNIIQDGEDFA